MDQDQRVGFYRAMVRGVYDDVEAGGGAVGLGQDSAPDTRVRVRSARLVQIGCQEIYLVETNEGCEVRSSMGTARLTKADLDLLIAELTSLRAGATREGE